MEKIAEWQCKNKHVMGVVVKMGNGVKVLLLYREAVGPITSQAEEETQLGEEVEVMAVVVGMARGVKCSICGAERTWVP